MTHTCFHCSSSVMIKYHLKSGDSQLILSFIRFLVKLIFTVVVGIGTDTLANKSYNNTFWLNGVPL